MSDGGAKEEGISGSLKVLGKTKETRELKRGCGGPLVEREILYN